MTMYSYGLDEIVNASCNKLNKDLYYRYKIGLLTLLCQTKEKELLNIILFIQCYKAILYNYVQHPGNIIVNINFVYYFLNAVTHSTLYSTWGCESFDVQLPLWRLFPSSMVSQWSVLTLCLYSSVQYFCVLSIFHVWIACVLQSQLGRSKYSCRHYSWGILCHMNERS